jgi:hypothetical protein
MEAEELATYSLKELQQLKEMTLQSLDHYVKMLKINSLKEGDKLALELCMKETQADIDLLNQHIENKK